ncbi:hypothetical protein [Mesorhizobium sp. M0019]|uniref:hypothetical protein n=1 Tax=Mesorhizobium sp. M0019 TaxID=2956845 RepID=UPI0033379A23
MPVNADINQVDVILVPEIDLDVNPAGVKGLGELGNVGTAAAVASAVYHARNRSSKTPLERGKKFAASRKSAAMKKGKQWWPYGGLTIRVFSASVRRRRPVGPSITSSRPA